MTLSFLSAQIILFLDVFEYARGAYIIYVK